MRTGTPPPETESIRNMSQTQKSRLFALLTLAFLIFAAGCNDATLSDRPLIAVTTSWLGCALTDVAGPDFQIVNLTSPGSCPGHFDMKPGQLQQVRRCRLLLRFDFQAGLEAKLSRLKDEGLRVISIRAPEGLCVPGSYLSACREVAVALSEVHPERADVFRKRVGEIETRMKQLSEKARDEVTSSGLSGTRVVSSRHQEAFCRWLGLNVVATLLPPDSESVSGLRDTITTGRSMKTQLVIGNLQDGSRQARRVAGALGVSVVSFGNFPAMTENERTFDELVTNNVRVFVRSRKP